MEIRRSAARRFDATWDQLVDDRVPVVEWDTTTNWVQLKANDEPDIYKPDVHYDFDVSLSVRDLALVLAVVSSDGIEHAPAEVRAALQNSALHLLRLLGCATGIIPGASPSLPNK